MPTIAVNDGLEYFYTDSGAPQGVTNYHTVIMIHGHSFHSGTFQRLLPIAPSKSMRLICINRREYPGTTPFSDDEKRVIVSGSDEERYTFFQKQGISLAKFVCRLIDQCAIPAPTLSKERVGSKEIKKGGITVGAWSLGNVYMISIVACIDVVDKEVRNQLQVYVTGFLLWDVPSQNLGAPEPPKSYLPLWDESLPLEDRRSGAVFAKWVSSHFRHGSDSTHNLDSLLYHWESDPSKKPTIETISRDELASMMEVTEGSDSESKIIDPNYVPVMQKQSMKALFDRDIRHLWKNTGFYLLYGAESPWNLTYGAWYIEDKVKEMEYLNQNEGEFKINICAQEGANHFPMWEIPGETWDVIIDCIGA